MLLGLLTIPALAADPLPSPAARPSSGCGRFKLNGYELGMTAEASAAVRPLKGVVGDSGMVSATVEDDVVGTLTFVDARLAEYRVRVDGEATSAADFRK